MYKEVEAYLRIKNYSFFGAIYAFAFEEAESLLGPRFNALNYEFGGFDFGSNRACVKYKGTQQNLLRNYYFIHLSKRAASERWLALWEISHECVHLLCPNPNKKNTVLEEGLACWYQTRWVDMCPSIFPDSLRAGDRGIASKSYTEARDLVTPLMDKDLTTMKYLRSIEPDLSKITSGMLIDLLGAEEDLASRLCSKFSQTKQTIYADNENWNEIVLNLNSSGLSIKRFAEKFGLNPKTLAAKRRELELLERDIDVPVLKNASTSTT